MSYRLKRDNDKRSETFPKEEVQTRGAVSISMTRGAAEAQIWYRPAGAIDEQEWESTPFQTSTARHDWDKAFELITAWLEMQA